VYTSLLSSLPSPVCDLISVDLITPLQLSNYTVPRAPDNGGKPEYGANIYETEVDAKREETRTPEIEGNENDRNQHKTPEYSIPQKLSRPSQFIYIYE